jgi:hypothetical protein
MLESAATGDDLAAIDGGGHGEQEAEEDAV